MKEKIFLLNKSYKKISEGINTIAKLYNNDKNVSVLLICFRKIHSMLNKEILILLEKEEFNKQWNEIVKQLNKEREDEQ